MPFDAFEDKLRQRLQGAEIPPDPGVWPGIEARVRKQPRQPFIYWLVAAAIALLLLAFGGWLAFGPELPRHPTPGERLSQAHDPQTKRLPVQPAPDPAVAAPILRPEVSVGALQPEAPLRNPPTPAKRLPGAALPGIFSSQSATPPPTDMAPLSPAKRETAARVASNSWSDSLIQPIAPQNAPPAPGTVTSRAFTLKNPSSSANNQEIWPEKQSQTGRFSIGAYALQESFFSGKTPFGPNQKSTNFYYDRRSSGVAAFSGLVWEVHSPSSQWSVGADLGYRISSRLEVRSGFGLFQTDSARVRIGVSEERLAAGERISNQDLFGLNPPPPAFVVQGVEAPLRVRYVLGGKKWVTDAGVGALLRLRLANWRFDALRSEAMDFSSAGNPVNQNSGEPPPQVVYLNRSLWSGTVDVGVSAPLAGQARLRFGPMAGYQPANWLAGPAALNPRPWSLGFHAALRWP